MSHNQCLPAPSRQSVSPKMAARGLRSLAELGLSKPHGTTVRFYAGCRCDDCRVAVKAYKIAREDAKERGEWNGLVDAAPVVAYMRKLSAAGIGKRQISEHACISTRTLDKLRRREQTKIREQAAKRILSLKPDAVRADSACVPAGPTWALLNELIASGYSMAAIGREVHGPTARQLQVRKTRVELATARRVVEIHARMRLATPEQSAKALETLAELRAEGFRPERILREVSALAEQRGLPAPTLEPFGKTGRVRGFEVALIADAYAAMTEVQE